MAMHGALGSVVPGARSLPIMLVKHCAVAILALAYPTGFISHRKTFRPVAFVALPPQ